MIGVNHFDPLQRLRLIAALQSLNTHYQIMPAFVGVEFDKDLFYKTVMQRPAFCKLLAQEWPDLDGNELNTLEQALVYEGDAHLTVFPSVPIVWLDAGRELPSDQGSEENAYARQRITTYKSYLKGASLHEALSVVSQRLREVADEGCIDLNRSAKFAKLLKKAAEEYSGKWALSITGADHTNASTIGSMAALCESLGLECERTVLC